jgi:hypothetical protein
MRSLLALVIALLPPAAVVVGGSSLAFAVDVRPI